MSIEPKTKRFLRRLRRHSSGVAAVEFALIAPVLAGILLPMVDFGIGAYEKMRVESAAEAGAQYALANASSYDASLITTAVQSIAAARAIPTAVSSARRRRGPGSSGSRARCHRPRGGGCGT